MFYIFLFVRSKYGGIPKINFLVPLEEGEKQCIALTISSYTLECHHGTGGARQPHGPKVSILYYSKLRLHELYSLIKWRKKKKEEVEENNYIASYSSVDHIKHIR